MLNGEPYTVTGIMPRGFQFTPFWITEAEMWAPLTMSGQAANRHTQVLRVMAQLKPGVSLEQARSEMDTIWDELMQQYPDTDSGKVVRVDSLKEKVVGNIRRPLLALLGAVIFVLLIEIGRASCRERE